jgi:hypothetical protein
MRIDLCLAEAGQIVVTASSELGRKLASADESAIEHAPELIELFLFDGLQRVLILVTLETHRTKLSSRALCEICLRTRPRW